MCFHTLLFSARFSARLFLWLTLAFSFLSASTFEPLNPLISNPQLFLQRRQLVTFSTFFLKFEIRPLPLSHYIPPVLFNRPVFAPSSLSTRIC